jgi:hypothetical protein
MGVNLQQLYITGKKIILDRYWLIGKGNSEGGTLRIAKCLTADKKLSPKFTRSQDKTKHSEGIIRKFKKEMIWQ